MATNIIHSDYAQNLYLPVPSGTLAGDAVAFGPWVGVALIDRDSDGYATVQLPPTTVVRVDVEGDDGGTPTAINKGANVYGDVSVHPTTYSATTTDTLIGVAIPNNVQADPLVAAGATTEILVKTIEQR